MSCSPVPTLGAHLGREAGARALGNGEEPKTALSVLAGRESTKRVLLLGDTHGNTAWFKWACLDARANECPTIIQLGDFGFFEHMPSDTWVEDVAELLAKTGRECIWVDGNHDNHELLHRWYGPGGPRHSPTDDGLWIIRPRLFYAPRGHRWSMGGRRFLALGGASSIDKADRVQGVDWWPTEDITYGDVARALSVNEFVDVMVTHDAPEGTPGIPVRRGWDWPASRANRELIREVVDILRPRLVAHGHHHIRHTTFLPRPGRPYDCRVEGFANDWRKGSYGVLHLRDLTVTKARSAQHLPPEVADGVICEAAHIDCGEEFDAELCACHRSLLECDGDHECPCGHRWTYPKGARKS